MTPTSLPGKSGRASEPPRSVGQLAKRVLAYAKQQGTSEKRTRDWISYMALSAALARMGGGGTDALFCLKGGVALELRLHGLARATQDLDTFYRGPTTSSVVHALEEAIAAPYERFTFRRAGEPLEMPHANTVRMAVRIRFDGTDWGTVRVDVSRGEPKGTDVELVEAFDITEAFGLKGPQHLPCMSLRHHVAQKIHGMTRPSTEPAYPNERVQDAVDVMLFQHEFALDATRAGLRQACEDVFTDRGTHSWPPVFSPPATWHEPFTVIAQELGLTTTDLDTATSTLRAFIESIVQVQGS